jgi:hypothetical protein
LNASPVGFNGRFFCAFSFRKLVLDGGFSPLGMSQADRFIQKAWWTSKSATKSATMFGKTASQIK